MNGATVFRSLTINAGSHTVLIANISVESQLTVSGTIDPNESPAHSISGNGKLSVNGGGSVLVTASTFAGNYALTGALNFSAGSTIDYAARTINQTVSTAPNYNNLRISGGTTKTLGGNLSGVKGDLTVAAGVLDLSTFAADAAGTGAALTVANGSTLKIGGTHTLPAGYSIVSLGGLSTVEYSGSNQTVAAQTYGNLRLTSSGGSVTKTLPASPMTVGGDFTSDIGSGTAVAFTAGAPVRVNGNVVIGPSTSFSGGAFVHTIGGNWTNNGTFAGNGGTIILSGSNKTIAGTGSNTFNNLTITGSGITAAAGNSMTITGNLLTSGAGSFTHLPGGPGTITMSGAGKTLNGFGITLNHFTVPGTISSRSTLKIAGNLTVSGSLLDSAGTITMSGAPATIGGPGTLAFYGLNIPGTVTTAMSFSVKSDVSVAGVLTATAGTVTFNGSSSLSGIAMLFNVTMNGTRLQLGSGTVLGIAGTLALTSGTFDVTTTVPNTVDYNSPGAQTITTGAYQNLMLSNGGTKSAVGGLTVNGNLTINSGATFNGGNLTHMVLGNWTNNGSFTPASGTIQFIGTRDASIAGVTTFNGLSLNKSSAGNRLVLQSDITVSTLAMIGGSMQTGSHAVTITSTRTGGGIIIGTVTRTHAFSDGTPYEFEGPSTTLTFANGAPAVSSISVTTLQNDVSDFPFDASVNREFDVSVSTGSAYSATLRLHYEDAELNGTNETGLQQWNFNGVSWTTSGATALDSSANWVEQSGITALDGRWTLADLINVASWTGALSSAWEDASNWAIAFGTPTLPPSTTDVVLLGSTSYTSQPLISSAVVVKNIVFESAQPTALSMGPGSSLTARGNIRGFWTQSAGHTIDVGSQTVVAGGDIQLSDGTAGHSISVSIGSGDLAVRGSLTQDGDAAVTWNGSGSLHIGGDFRYAAGTFAPGSGSVVYNGPASQIVAGGIPYNNLTLDKFSGTASLLTPSPVQGNLLLSNGGTFLVGAELDVSGSVTIGPSGLLDGDSSTISVGGDWNRSGIFYPNAGTILLNGTQDQAIAPSTFNNLTILKTGGVASSAGNLLINEDLTVASGTLDLVTFTATANRTTVGGALTLAGGSTLKIGGANNFPAKFEANNLALTSTVDYDGTQGQTAAAVPYGNLTFTGGGSNAKLLSGFTAVAGDLLINNGATLNADSFATTVGGNWINNGSFLDSTSTIVFTGTSKTIGGNTTFNDLIVTGAYTALNDILVQGSMNNPGSLETGGTSAAFAGDFSNTGSFSSSGTVTFAGASVQNLALNSGFTSSGEVIFAGTVAPVFSDVTAPVLGGVTISNTGGLAPDVGWAVGGGFTVAGGSSFSGGELTHTFNGAFTNNGTVTSSGTLAFSPSGPADLQFLGTSFSSSGTVALGGTGDIHVVGAPPVFASVVVTNLSANGVVPLSNWTLTGDLFVAPGSVLSGGTGLTHTVSGNWTVNGLFDGAASAVILNSAAGSGIGGNGSTTFNDLTVAGIVTALSGFGISGNFTDNGSFDATGVTVSFTGSGPSVISGSSAPVSFDQLTVAKNSAATSLGVNLTGLTALTVASGTLDLSTFSVTQNAGGVLTLMPGSLLSIGGSNALPVFTTYSFDPASSVAYSGTGPQTLSAAPVYGNLVLSNTGTKTAQDSLVLQGNFMQSGGTFAGGPFTHRVGGDWLVSGGAFNAAGTTVLLDGTGPQGINTTTPFGNLTIDKPSGSCTAGSDVTVGGVLALNAGNVITGPNKVIIGSTGSVSRTSGHVAGYLQKSIPAGSSAVTFEVGDSNRYAPIDVSFPAVTTPGTLTAGTIAGEHPLLSSASINPAKDVNRYWTLTNNGIAFSTYDATFSYQPSDPDSGANPALFAVQKLDSAAWSSPATGALTSTSTQALGMTSFSDYIVGEIGFDTIMATAGPHGSISPSGMVRIEYGHDTTFTVTPDSGYFITDVHVDSGSVGQVDAYMFTNVRRNHVIDATFGVNPVPHLTGLSPAALYRGQSGDLTFTGSNFVNGASSVNAGPGIMVNTVVVRTTDTLVASISVLPNAAVGTRTFSVTNTPDGGTSGSVSFSILNHPPQAFALIGPASGDTIQLTTVTHPVTFSWHRPLDVDGDTLSYVLHLPGILGDSVNVIGDTSVSVDIMNMLALDAAYSWSVTATDGYDSVASADTFAFRTSSVVTSVRDNGKQIPKAYALYQNYPNPFNPGTLIRYDLPHASLVTMTIYNLLGQQVERLMNGAEVGAGTHEISFDGSGFVSGIYLLRIEATETGGEGRQFTQVRKMTLLK